MFLWDWLTALMVYLGKTCISTCTRYSMQAWRISCIGVWRRPAKLVFTGLDNTGKTTMLYMLNDGHVSRSNYSSELSLIESTHNVNNLLTLQHKQQSPLLIYASQYMNYAVSLHHLY